MRAIIQRVKEASVKVDNKIVGEIGQGYLILFGAGKNDNEDILEKFWLKIRNMRIFSDQNGKTNLDINAVQASVLLVSQFTLYADCRKGNRPSFTDACPAAKAEDLYNKFIDLAVKDLGEKKVGRGVFGADMEVSLINDGPFTIYLDSNEIIK